MFLLAITLILIVLYVAIFALQSVALNGLLGEVVRYASAVVKWALRITMTLSALKVLFDIILAVRAASITGDASRIFSFVNTNVSQVQVGMAVLALLRGANE